MKDTGEYERTARPAFLVASDSCVTSIPRPRLANCDWAFIPSRNLVPTYILSHDFLILLI